jgi:hypothetical protein
VKISPKKGMPPSSRPLLSAYSFLASNSSTSSANLPLNNTLPQQSDRESALLKDIIPQSYANARKICLHNNPWMHLPFVGMKVALHIGKRNGFEGNNL